MIATQEQIDKIKSDNRIGTGDARIDGTVIDGVRYWIITDCIDQITLHVPVADYPHWQLWYDGEVDW